MGCGSGDSDNGGGSSSETMKIMMTIVEGLMSVDNTMMVRV